MQENCYHKLYNGAWLSLVERCVRDAEVACSNHVAPSMVKSAGILDFKGVPVLFVPG